MGKVFIWCLFVGVFLGVLWLSVRVVRHAWGDAGRGKVYGTINVNVRVQRAEEAPKVLGALLPALEDYRR